MPSLILLFSIVASADALFVKRHGEKEGSYFYSNGRAVMRQH